MRGHAEIIRTLEREPRKEFSTTQLVQALYPDELKAIRERQEYGTKDQRRKAQTAKSALHRKALYHIGRLVTAGILRVVRLDAHGEKVYTVTPGVRAIDTKEGTVAFENKTVNTGELTDELRERNAFLYGEQSVLTRYNAVYLDASRVEGLGQVLRLTELAVRLTDDVVAIGNLHTHKGTFLSEAIQDFISAISVLTLDEGRRCVLMTETRGADPVPVAKALATLTPRRVSAVLVVDGTSLAEPRTAEAIHVLRTAFEKVTIQYVPSRAAPLFPGRGGTFGFSDEQYARFVATRGIPLTVVTATSACVDLERLSREQPHAIRETLGRVATGLFSIAAQQRLVGTGAGILQAIHPEPAALVRDASIMVRLWNYDWETSGPVIASARDELFEDNRRHASVYRACGIAIHPQVQLSSAFPRFHPDLSGRTYRKWTVQGPHDLTTDAFRKYCGARLAVNASFGGIDRLRVFRSGQPSGAEVAHELGMLGAAGFGLITYDFKPLVGVRRLTEFFG